MISACTPEFILKNFFKTGAVKHLSKTVVGGLFFQLHPFSSQANHHDKLQIINGQKTHQDKKNNDIGGFALNRRFAKNGSDKIKNSEECRKIEKCRAFLNGAF